MKRQDIEVLLKNLGQRYSEILDINLTGGASDEIFKWFLASVLFGAPITETSAIKTYRCFQKHNVLTPERILQAGWDRLVKILDEGSYARYDFKTADKLLEVAQHITANYSGDLAILHKKAADSQDLEKRLKSLGKGIGVVTVSIFLREMRGVWEKADSKPTALEILAARRLGIVSTDATETALNQLKAFWARHRIQEKDFVHFETALVRFGRETRKGKKPCVLSDARS